MYLETMLIQWYDIERSKRRIRKKDMAWLLQSRLNQSYSQISGRWEILPLWNKSLQDESKAYPLNRVLNLTFCLETGLSFVYFVCNWLVWLVAWPFRTWLCCVEKIYNVWMCKFFCFGRYLLEDVRRTEVSVKPGKYHMNMVRVQ